MYRCDVRRGSIWKMEKKFVLGQELRTDNARCVSEPSGGYAHRFPVCLDVTALFVSMPDEVQ